MSLFEISVIVWPVSIAVELDTLVANESLYFLGFRKWEFESKSDFFFMVFTGFY